MTLHLPDGQAANSYFSLGRFPSEPSFLVPEHWCDFTFDPLTDTGTECSGGRVVLHFVDGGRGDIDQLPNGSITDPGGPAVFSASDGGSSGGAGCSMLLARTADDERFNVDFLLMLLGLTVLRRWHVRLDRSRARQL